jgi:tetratricopeptide (TPR) repeat protein
VAIDREQTLKKAEKLLRQGRLDGAIEEYQRVLDKHPHDWNTANALGDCYARAQMVERATELYNQIGDHFAKEGFFSKAAALYKKSLKILPTDEHALSQAAEMAIRQSTLVEAKHYLQQLAARLQQRGQAKSAAEILLRIASLDPSDLDARLAGARAVAETGGGELVAPELLAVAQAHEAAGHADKAFAVLVEAARIVPNDDEIRAALARAYAGRGDLEQARSHARSAADFVALADLAAARGDTRASIALLTEAHIAAPDETIATRLVLAHSVLGEFDQAAPYVDAIGETDDLDLQFAVGTIRARQGDVDTARAAFARLLAREPNRAAAVAAEGERLAALDPDAALVHLEAAADIFVLHGDFAAAATAYEAFVLQQPDHIPALLRLVEISVDGELATTQDGAEASLVDAYLAQGNAADARTLAETLLARHPEDPAHVQRLSKALALLGETPHLVQDSELDLGTPDQPAQAVDAATTSESGESDAAPVEAAAAAGDGQDPFQLGPVAIDLRDILGDQASAQEPADGDANQPPMVKPGARDLDEVFGGLREQAARQSGHGAAERHYKIALAYRDMGMSHEAIRELQAAAASPRLRFEASALLARLFLERGDSGNAIEWLERAAEAPAPTVEAGRTLLYDLGDTLEAGGETARALAVFLELQADAADFRDVARRVERLSRVQTGG